MTHQSHGRNSIVALERILPPEAGADEGVDWEALSRAWELRFPSDYVAFMGIYGAGGISDSLEVLRPERFDRDDVDAMVEETANARDQWVPGATVSGSDGDPGTGGAVVAWGVTTAGDVICWVTSDPDPDRWPVAVLRPSLVAPWVLYPVGMAEFLRRLIIGAFDACPVSDATLWNAGTGRFLHWRERQRRLEEGIDPWTGEPDPYAGIGFDD
ncbi:SMI1/KNR4 family protein [Streptomyces sp. NPDC054847]